MSTIKQKMDEYLESEIGQDIMTLLAYTVRRTATTKDDEILDNIDDVKDSISEAIDKIADVYPDDKEAKEAIIRVLTLVAGLTKTKWDDRAVGIVKLLL